MGDHDDMLITSIKRALEGFHNAEHAIEPATPQGIRYMAQFESKIQMDTWLFCASNPYSLKDWARRHFAMHHREPNAEWLAKPKAIPLDEDGQLSVENFKRINHDLSPEECSSGGCRVCWGTGLAYIIRGVLYSELTGIPGPFVATPCWCGKTKEKG